MDKLCTGCGTSETDTMSQAAITSALASAGGGEGVQIYNTFLSETITLSAQGSYQDILSLQLPAGSYLLGWSLSVNPKATNSNRIDVYLPIIGGSASYALASTEQGFLSSFTQPLVSKTFTEQTTITLQAKAPGGSVAITPNHCSLTAIKVN